MDLTLDGICKSFGAVQALQPLHLSVPSGSLVGLLGPSGCGKTTTLRIIAGFEQADAGRVLVGGTDMSNLAPNRRRLGMVFQNYSLFPHMNVFDNVAFGLRRAGCNRAEVASRVAQALEMVRLSGFAERWPSQMSGGQQQRVALARSIVTRPAVLLLDEPLGALDKNLRESMQFELRQLQRLLVITTVLVTHDQEEALTMADQVAVMHDGRLLQLGAPDAVYNRPCSRFVAEFLGTSNIFRGAAVSASGGRVAVRLQGMDAVVHVAGDTAAQSAVEIAVRPERMVMRHPGTISGAPGENALSGEVTGLVFRGSYRAFQIRIESTGQIVFAYLAPQAREGFEPEMGQKVSLSFTPQDAVILGA